MKKSTIAPFMSQKKYSKKLELVANCERLNSPEFIVQFCAVAISVFVTWLCLELWPVLVWFCVHYTAVFSEKAFLIYALRRPSQRMFALALFLNLLIGCIYASLPAYLWLVDDEVFKFAAMALLVGATLNTLLIRSSLWQILLCYLVPNAFVFAVIAISFWQNSGFSNETLVALTITFSIFTYFLVAVYEAYRMHLKHSLALKTLVETKKLDAIGRLTSGVAHDFNNLLNVIGGNTELLQQPDNPYSQQTLLKEISTATRRGASLVQHLLTYSRQSELSPKTIQIEEFLYEFKWMLSRLLPKNIDVELSIDGKLPPVEIDESELYSALINIAINSRDAMPEGGKLQISASHVKTQPTSSQVSRNSGEESSFLRLFFVDDGVGIPPDHLEKVVDPFFTTKKKGEGTGLGLATVSGFVKQSKGHFFIKSNFGKGTQIELLFPIKAKFEEGKEYSDFRILGPRLISPP